MQITNNTVAVTGANRGIGLALASMFATEKNHLIIINRRADPMLEKRFLELGALSVKSIAVDLSDISQTEKVSSELAKMNIDVLVNNAGLLTGGQIETQTTKDIVSMFNVNLVSLVLLTKAVVPGMVKRGRGKIINNASVSGKMFLPSANTYSASKAGVVGFTESLKVELQGTGVTTLLLITPGIKTDMFDQIATKYSGNMDVSSLSAISPSQWAQEVKLAFINDEARLLPKGITRLGVFVGHHFPDVLGRLVSTRFKRIN
jgi:short-subunit dehydrogenase